ncbi:MAG: ribosomal protein S18-alanine N-acetyltransferase [Oscillospiraceae bacterium]
MNYTIRKAVQSDLAAMCEIEKECIADPWSIKAFESEFSARGALFLTAESENGEVCGFITANAVLDEINIYNVAVREGFRRLGIASVLLAKLEEEKPRVINLEVRESNAAAIALYEKCGFEQVGRRKNFYSKPTENAVLMSKVCIG